MKKCNECGEYLIPVGNKFWMHPESETCRVLDGLKILISDGNQFDKFQSKYGKVIEMKEILKKMNKPNQTKELNSLKKENAELRETITALEELAYHHQRRDWGYRIQEWLINLKGKETDSKINSTKNSEK